ncbi:ABC transporter permease [Proteinivorax hydrogeniformans]|uniref:ABC transporter permease n=1 Tax=Proteinivorax hydrogeniformans TaxID=1826727 RepID=A0AAU8HVP7_9FIRM
MLATLLIGVLLGIYAKSPSRLIMYSQIIFLPSMMLSGIMFPADMLPTVLETIGLILPATHGMRILAAESFIASSYLTLILFIILSLIIIGLRLKRLNYEDVH